jgi:hypothetical protein
MASVGFLCSISEVIMSEVKMVEEGSLSSLSSSEDEPDFNLVDSKEIQHNSGLVSAQLRISFQM